VTLQKAKSIARHLGLTLRQLRSGNYRVNYRDGNEITAYYTDKLEDAVNAAVAMAGKRAFSSDCRADRIRGGLTAFSPPAGAQ
jgi:L-ribulose-5-phosphate 3-epimerase UlaE